jgi:ABC-type maltose transport system permease subunit
MIGRVLAAAVILIMTPVVALFTVWDDLIIRYNPDDLDD